MTITLKTANMQLAADALRQEIAKLRGDRYVTVGIHEGAPQPEGGEINMATLGAIHEFGTADGHIPARPWLVPGMQAATGAILEEISDSVADGRTVDQIMERVGVVAVGEVQQYITDLRTPPNAPSTIAKKGSDNPLIDTGAMRQSVTYQVRRGRPEEGL